MARTYTQPEKADAVALYVEHGLAEAHRRTGIPKPTLKRWLDAAGIDPTVTAEHSVEKTRAAVEAHTARLADLRTQAQVEFALSTVHAATKVREAEKGTDAHGWAMASGTMLDKLRLEQGEATDRTEHVAVPERTPEAQEEMDRTLRLVQDMAA